MNAKIYITLKTGVLDPQGKAVKHSLETLNFKEVEDVRIGKFVELKLKNVSKADAEKHVKDMCERLLANTVIESYRFEIME
jgi:phosphoribosylformylglycinamidine synthase